jgi:hypothetical protein
MIIHTDSLLDASSMYCFFIFDNHATIPEGDYWPPPKTVGSKLYLVTVAYPVCLSSFLRSRQRNVMYITFLSYAANKSVNRN